MIEAKKKEIDGLQVIVTEWPARKALKIKLRLGRLFGSSVRELLSSAKSINKESLLDSDIDMNKVGSAIEKLFENVSEDDFDRLITVFMSSVFVDDQDMSNEQNFNNKFSGNLASFYKIVWFVLQVNYKSFFVQGGIGKMMENIQKKMSSPKMPPENSVKT